MQRQCPHCQLEYFAEVDLCPRCGETSGAAPQRPAEAPSPTQNAAGVGAEDGPPRGPARECPRPTAAAAVAGGRGDEGSQYHRSVRTVALAGAFSTVLMVAGLVAVVIIFCAKIESLASKGQEREAEFSRTVAQQVEALHKILDELSQGRKEDRETVAELRRQLEKYAAQQPSQADFDALRNEVVALRRAAFLNAPLSPREREALKGKLQRVAANASWKTRQTLSKLERAVTAGNYTRKAVSDMAREARQDIKDERARAKFDAEGLGQFNAE